MEEFYPSEIARLVLGYLKEAKCSASWQTFLDESSDLHEYNRLLKEGKIYPTNVNGKSLLDILSEYCALKREAINNENQNRSKDNSQSSDSEAFKTPNKAVRDAFSKFTLNQKLQTQSVSLSYGRNHLRSPSVRNDIYYYRSPTSRPISRRLYEGLATPLNFGQDAESTCNIESTNQINKHMPSSYSSSSAYKTPCKRGARTVEKTCLSEPVASRHSIQDRVVQTDLVSSEGRTNVGRCNIQAQQLNLPISSNFTQNSPGAAAHYTKASHPEDHSGNSGYAASSESNVAAHNTVTDSNSVSSHPLNESLTVLDPAAHDLEKSSAILNKSLVYRSSEITTNDGNITVTTLESSVTPQYVSDPPTYNRAPNTNSPRIILSLDRSQISSLTTPMKEKHWTEDICSPRRKGIPRRRLLSESPAPKQQMHYPETVPSSSTMHDNLDFDTALDEFFSYQPLAEKIAENINKAKCSDELKETEGSNSYSTLQDTTGAEEIIKNVLARTAADPVFDEYLSILYSKFATGTRDCSMGNSLQEANFSQGGFIPSHRVSEASGTDISLEKNNLENKKSSETNAEVSIVSTDVCELEQTENEKSSDHRYMETKVASNSVPSNVDINCEMSSDVQKCSQITNNICTKNSGIDFSDKNGTDIPDGVTSSFTKTSEITSCSVGNENRNLNSTECNISAPQSTSELNSVKCSSDSVKIIEASYAMEVDTEIKKGSAEKETLSSNTESIQTDMLGDTLNKVVQLANVTDSNSNQIPATQAKSRTAPIFELPCPSVPTLLVPGFASNNFPLQSNVQYQIILPAGFGTPGCETYLPLPTFQLADNVITNPEIITSPSNVTGNLEAHPDSIGNYISLPPKTSNSISSFNCTPVNSPAKVKIPKTQSKKRKKIKGNEDSSKRRDTDSKSPATQNNKKRKYTRFPKKKLRPLFPSPTVKNKQDIIECVDDDIPVLSIPESSPANSDHQTAFELFSKITNKEEQSPGLKTLISSAKVLSNEGGRLNSTHVRYLDFDSASSKRDKENESEEKDVQSPANRVKQSPGLKTLISSAKVLSNEGGRLNSTHVCHLDFDSTSSKQDKESGNEKEGLQNRRSERIKRKNNLQVPEVKSFCSEMKKRLKANKYNTLLHKNKRKMGSPRKVLQVNEPNSLSKNITSAIISCMEEALQKAILYGDRDTSIVTDNAEVNLKCMPENSSDQNNSSNTVPSILPDSNAVNTFIDSSSVPVISTEEYFPEVSNSPCILDTNQDTCVKGLSDSLKDIIPSQSNKHESTASTAYAYAAEEKSIENKSNSTPNEGVLGRNSELQKDTAKKNIPDVGKNVLHSKNKYKSKKRKKFGSVKCSDISASTETEKDLLTGVSKSSSDYNKGIGQAADNTSILKEIDSVEVLCSKKQLVVSVVPLDANLDHETKVENVYTLQNQDETKITMCQKQDDLSVESKNLIQNPERDDLSEKKSVSEMEGIKLDSNSYVSKSPDKSQRKKSVLQEKLPLSTEKFTDDNSSPVSKQFRINVDISSDNLASADTDNMVKNTIVENISVQKNLSSDTGSQKFAEPAVQKNVSTHFLGFDFNRRTTSISNPNSLSDNVSNSSSQPKSKFVSQIEIDKILKKCASIQKTFQETCKNKSPHLVGFDFSKGTTSISNPNLLVDNVRNSSSQHESSHVCLRETNKLLKKYAYLLEGDKKDGSEKSTSTPQNLNLSSNDKTPTCNIEPKFTEKSESTKKSSSVSDSFEMVENVALVKCFARENQPKHVPDSQKCPRTNFITSYFYPSSSVSQPADLSNKASDSIENSQIVDKIETTFNSLKTDSNKTYAEVLETESDNIPKYSDVSPLNVISNNEQVAENSVVESKLSANVIVSETSNKSYKAASSRSVASEKTYLETTISSETSMCEIENYNSSAKSPSPSLNINTVKTKCAQNIEAVSPTSNSVDSRKSISPKVKLLSELALSVSLKEKINITSIKYDSKISSPQKISSHESEIRPNCLTYQKDISPKDSVHKSSPELDLSNFYESSDFKKKDTISQEKVELQKVVSSERLKTSALNISSKLNLKDALAVSYEAAQKRNLKSADLLSSCSGSSKNKQTVNSVELSVKDINAPSSHCFKTVELLPEPAKAEKKYAYRNASPCKVAPPSGGQLSSNVQSVSISENVSQICLISPRKVLQTSNNKNSKHDCVKKTASPVKDINTGTTLNKTPLNSRSKVIESSSYETHRSSINEVHKNLNDDKSEYNKSTDSPKSPLLNTVSKSVDIHNSSSCVSDISGNKYENSSELPAKFSQSLDSFPSRRSPNVNTSKSMHILPKLCGHENDRVTEGTSNNLQKYSEIVELLSEPSKIIKKKKKYAHRNMSPSNITPPSSEDQHLSDVQHISVSENVSQNSSIVLDVGKSCVKVGKILSPASSPSITPKISPQERTSRCSGYSVETNGKKKDGAELLIPKVSSLPVKQINSDDLTDTGSFVSGTLEIDEKWSESDKPSETDKNSSDELIDNFEVNIQSKNLVSGIVEQKNSSSDKAAETANKYEVSKNTNLIKSPNKASLPKVSSTKENSKTTCQTSANEVTPVSNIFDSQSSRTILYSPDKEKFITLEKLNLVSSTSQVASGKKHLSLPHCQTKITNQQTDKNNSLNKERYKHPETIYKYKQQKNLLEDHSNSSASGETSSLTYKVLPPPKKRIRPVPIGSPSSQSFITYTPFMSNNTMINVTADSKLVNASKKQSHVKTRTETFGVENNIRGKERCNETKNSSFAPNSVLETESNHLSKPANLTNNHSKKSPLKSVSSFSEPDSPMKQPAFKTPIFKSPSPKKIDVKQFSPNQVLPSGKPKAMSEIYRNAFPNKDLPVSPISFSNSSCTGDAFLAKRQLIDNESCSISPSKISERGVLESCPKNERNVHNKSESAKTYVNVEKSSVVNSEMIVENPDDGSSKACSSKDHKDEELIGGTSKKIRKISESNLSDTCSTLVDCSDLEIMTPEKHCDFLNDELFSTASSPRCRRKRKLSKLCSSPDCSPDNVNKTDVSSDNINLSAKCQRIASPSHLTSNKISKSKTPAKNASQNFPHLLANLNQNSMTAAQRNINKEFAVSFPNARSPNKNIKSSLFTQYPRNSSVRQRIAHKSHVKDNFYKPTIFSPNITSAKREASSITNKRTRSISPRTKRSPKSLVKNSSRINSRQSSHNYWKPGQRPHKISSPKFPVSRSKMNSKNYQDSPIRSISSPKRLINKTALSKKLEQDPCIPAGVKIPSKWNSKKIINYSDAIGQSSTYRDRSKTNGSTGKRIRLSRPTLKIATLQSPVKMAHTSEHCNIQKSYSDVTTKSVENEKYITKEALDENKKKSKNSSKNKPSDKNSTSTSKKNLSDKNSTSISKNSPSDRNSKKKNYKKNAKPADKDTLAIESTTSNDESILKFIPEKTMKTYDKTSQEKDFIARQKQPSKFIIDYENTRDMVESDIGRSNEEGSELANAIAFLTKSVSGSEMAHVPASSEENALEELVKSVGEPGSTTTPAKKVQDNSKLNIQDNAKLNLLLSKIHTIGLDSILDLIKSREKD